MSYRNLAQMQRLQAHRLGERVAVRYKKDGLYHDVSWRAYRAQAEACAAALVDVGIRPGDRVGLLAENRLEWLVADMGILTAAAVNVPLHAPLSARQIQFQLADAGVRWLIVSTPAQLDKVRSIRSELPDLQGVVVFDNAPSLHDARSWAGFLHRGRMVQQRHRTDLGRREDQRTLDDLATIMYTSGTTGNPKGVMLTHGNLLSNALAMDEASPRRADDILFNWLPLSHIYARTVDHYLSQVIGVVLCLAETPDTVVQNLAEVEPTHLSSVPRLYEKLLSLVAPLDPAEKRRRLHALFGRRIDWLGSGGAPLPLPVAQAFEEMGLLILQGYGLTESSPVISFNRKHHYKLASVGQAIPGVEIKIADDGEVLTRGPHVMKGYWNNPPATAEAIKDGWLHTGDLGQLDAEGFLTITGRKKELLVLSNGKKVVPTQLEGLLVADACIDQAVVCGEGRNFLSALIVPNWTNLRKALYDAGVNRLPDGEEALARHPSVQGFLAQRCNKALADLSSWEQVKKLVIVPQAFSVAAEELTVSLKLRRNVIVSHYEEALETLYRE